MSSARTNPTTTTGPRPGQLRALALATLAFTACFYAWSLLGPLSPDLQKAIGLSDFQTSVMVAVPVLLGSLMPVPLGVLTDHFGARRTMTALIAASLPPVVGLAPWHASLAVVLALGLWLGIAGSSFAAGVSDRVGAERVLRLAFAATALLALGLAAGYRSIVPFTALCLSIAVAFGVGTGAVFKLVPSWFPENVGAVTGVAAVALFVLATVERRAEHQRPVRAGAPEGSFEWRPTGAAPRAGRP